MKLNLRNKALSVAVITYSILSVLRSTGLLYLVYSDSYFYDFKFDLNEFSNKISIYQRFYYYIPYLIGMLIIILIRRIFQTRLLNYCLASLFGIIIFWLIDSDYVRPLFALFENTRINILIIALTFLIISIAILIFNVKNKNLIFSSR